MLEVFWIGVLLFALQPILMTRILERKRRQKITDIEIANGSRVIVLIHRQETVRFLGVPFLKYIDMQDSEEVLRAIHLTDDTVPIDLILHTPGGLALASTQIARALRAHPAKVRVHIPHMAMSGGTLVALAADEIVMSDHAVLGPVDPQINEYPAISILNAVALKPVSEVDDQTLIEADVARKAISQLRVTVGAILPSSIEGVRKNTIVDALSGGDWTHDYPIFPDEAVLLGLNVSTEIPSSVLDLMTMYPQPVQMGQRVEYDPRPRWKVFR